MSNLFKAALTVDKKDHLINLICTNDHTWALTSGWLYT